MPIVSIIIPHFERWEKLGCLLNSIPINPLIEIIVIDDWSKNYLTHFRRLNQEYPHVIFLSNDDEKKGAGSARNVGIKKSKGKWLLFADSDDIFLDGFFEKIQKYLESTYDMVYFVPNSFVDITNEKSNRHIDFEKYVLNYHYNPNKYNELKLRYFFSPPWSKLISRCLVIDNKIKFEERPVGNDVLFSGKVGYYSQKIKTDLDSIYLVREHKASLTGTISEKNFRCRLEGWLVYIDFLRGNLSESEYKSLNFSALTHVLQVFEYKLGLNNLRFVFKSYREHNIPIIDKRLINPNFVLNYLKKTRK